MALLSLKACVLVLALAAVAAADRRFPVFPQPPSPSDDRRRSPNLGPSTTSPPSEDRRRPSILVPFTAPAATDVLVLRFGWPLVFCYSGASNATPEQFCGFNPPARSRFRAIRALRMYYATATNNLDSCPDPTAGYVDSNLDKKVREALSCISNSYSLPNNDAEWNAYVWSVSGTCVAEHTGMDAAYYYKLIDDLFERYNPDLALKKAGIDTAKDLYFNQTAALDILEQAYGQKFFVTCDTATKTYLSTVSMCLTTSYPFTITACPARLLRSGRDCALPMGLEVPPPSSSIPVTKECERYYPATEWPDDDGDDDRR